jgi:hypothetical protein
MNVVEVLELLEKRSKEHKESSDCRALTRTPEGRIAAQIHSSIAEELDALVAEIRERMGVATTSV